MSEAMGIIGRGVARRVRDVLSDLERELQEGTANELVPVPTGFTPLDTILNGGLHPGALAVIGGSPGVGKTIMTMQWARHIAASGRDVVYVCYEHDETELLVRLLSMELEGLPSRVAEEVRRAVVTSASAAGAGLREILDGAAGSEVLERLDRYADRLHLVRASGAHTGVAELEEYVDATEDEHPVLVVDYLQKVSLVPEAANEAEKVTRVTESLKDLALRRAIPVVAVVAIEMAGLKDRRVRMHHFRGSSALVFESDVALVLDEKFNAISKVHLSYDPLRAATFRDWVVMSVEKNRGGPAKLDLEFRKDFSHFRFDPQGGFVEEKLADERIDDI